MDTTTILFALVGVLVVGSMLIVIYFRVKETFVYSLYQKTKGSTDGQGQ